MLRRRLRGRSGRRSAGSSSTSSGGPRSRACWRGGGRQGLRRRRADRRYPVLGRRERDLRSGFVLPDCISTAVRGPGLGAVDSALTWRTSSGSGGCRLPVVVKGILTAEDAPLACEPASTASSCRTTAAASSTASRPARRAARGRRCGRRAQRGLSRRRRAPRHRRAQGAGARRRAVLVGRPSSGASRSTARRASRTCSSCCAPRSSWGSRCSAPLAGRRDPRARDVMASGDELTRELDDLRGRHEGVVDVLRALSRSGMRLQPILDQIVATAARLCRSDSCFVYLAEGELLRMRANIGQPQEVVEYERLHPDRPGPGSCTGRVAMTKKPVHIPDVTADPEYSYPAVEAANAARAAGAVRGRAGWCDRACTRRGSTVRATGRSR